jgi:hypothetical protein
MKSKFLLSMMAMALIFGFSACSFGSKEEKVGTSSNTEVNTATMPAGQSTFETYTPSEWANYQHESFTFAYPSDWTMKENEFGTLVAVLSPVTSEADIFSENCNVVLDDSTEAATYASKEYFELSVAQLPSFITNYEEISRGSVMMGGVEAYYVAYNGQQGNYDLSWVQYLTKGEKNHYILTCTAQKQAFTAYKDTFDQVASKMSVK